MWQYQYPDELYHWKYIKRVRKNGKWRYYYDESANELTNRRKAAEDAQEIVDVQAENHIQKMYNQDMRDAIKNLKSNPDGPKNVENWYKSDIVNDGVRNEYWQGDHFRWKARHTKALYEQHKKTVDGKVDAFMEKHGRNIASTLNGVSDSISNGMKWVKKKLRIN